MVVVGDRPTLLQLVRKATSFSCSLGAAMTIAMIPLLSELEDKPFEERPVLYACENDHDAVRRVGEMVTSKVTTVPCMVDRICTGRQIGEYEVNVEAEPNFGGSLVLLDPPSDPSLVPFAGTTVLIPSTREEASYFYKRKFSVVNGMHTVLGFMTLREKAPGAKELREHDLLAYDTASPEIRAELWAWVVVRCLALLDEFGVDMLKSAHDLETEEEVFDVLLDYGGQALDRFSSVVDSTSRVLGGGLGNRLTTRLQPMVVFMKNNTMKGSGLPGERFLERAGVEEVFAREAIKSLARSSVSFCTQDFMAAKKARVEARALKAAKVEENKATRVVPDAKAQSGKASSGKQEPSVAQG
uniref:Mannitol-1-phosphate dehydrogenase 2 n=1 Tax=Saccharina japonica TaxID=88149 RepID=A0A2Z4BWZ7_SACJA|nr:mannitol-1-phosphate dehydrogenase 2 [Saccharina japonica]